MNKICTSLEQSKKLIELGIDVNTADMFWKNGVSDKYIQCFTPFVSCGTNMDYDYDIPAWSLSALLKLIPKHILRKDKIHYGQTFIPSFRWEITPTAIYYTDGNDIMDDVSFRYGENNIELINAAFDMVCWLLENKKL